MKKIFLVVVLVGLAFIWVNRQRVYLRDPLATVYRNDIKQTGVQVFINYSNDVLLERDANPGTYGILVQAWNKMPGVPKELTCVHWMACMADADHATIVPVEGVGKGKYDPHVSMTAREVSFVDGDATTLRITLR